VLYRPFEVFLQGFSDKRKRFVLVRDVDLLYRFEIAYNKTINAQHDNRGSKQRNFLKQRWSL